MYEQNGPRAPARLGHVRRPPSPFEPPQNFRFRHQKPLGTSLAASFLFRLGHPPRDLTAQPRGGCLLAVVHNEADPRLPTVARQAFAAYVELLERVSTDVHLERALGAPGTAPARKRGDRLSAHEPDPRRPVVESVRGIHQGPRSPLSASRRFPGEDRKTSRILRIDNLRSSPP